MTTPEPPSVDARQAVGVQVGNDNTQIVYQYNLRTWGDGVASPPIATVSGAVDSPYRGLARFEERDAAFFFGRESVTEEIVARWSERLNTELAMVVVSGASGAGKSSLIRAGVIPRLRGAGLPAAPGAAHWPCLLFTPGRRPLDELALQLAQLASVDAPTLRRTLVDDPTTITLITEQAVRRNRSEGSDDHADDASGARLLLIIDQFEQVFTQCEDDEHRAAFLIALHAICAGTVAPALVLLTVRADFESRCSVEPLLAAGIQDRYLVVAMTERQLRASICEPARKLDATVEPTLVDALLDELAAGRRAPDALVGAGVLPLLSYALDQAWRHRAGPDLTLSDYERTGGVERAVDRSAQATFDRLPGTQQALARDLFLKLIVTDSDGHDAGVRVRTADFVAGHPAGTAVEVGAVIEAFAAERMLTLGAGTVELSHEVLLSAWRLLRDEWLAETHARRVVLSRLRLSAAEWDRYDHDPAYLYSGSLLDTSLTAAGEASSTTGGSLVGTEARFLAASRRRRERARRASRATILGLSLLLALSLVITVVAYRQRAATVALNRISVARQLAATAVNLADTDMQQAALIAVQAYQLHPDAQTAAALYTTSAASPQLVGFLDAGADVTAVTGTPDGRYVLVGTVTGQVFRWDRESGQRELLLELAGQIGRVMTSDNSATVAAWVGSNSIYDQGVAGTGAVWHAGLITPVPADIVALSPSGSLMALERAAGTNGATVSVVTTADLTHRVVEVHLPNTQASVLLPDDHRLVTVDSRGPLLVFAIPSGRQIVTGLATTGAHPYIAAVDPAGVVVAVTNGAKAVEIDAIRSQTGSKNEATLAGYGRTESPAPAAFAISPGGKRLATAVDGRIWVGAISSGPREDLPSPTVLTGSGKARDGTLRFLDDNLLLSGAGTSVAIWDLAQTSRLRSVVHMDYQISCNACGPGVVLVSPDGSRALVLNEGRSAVDLVDFHTGTALAGGYDQEDAAHLLAAGALWLDDDHLLEWYDTPGVLAIWSGDALQHLDMSWQVAGLRRTSNTAESQVVLGHTGDTVTLSDNAGRLLVMDIAHRTVQQSGHTPWADASAVGLDSAGTRVWALESDEAANTRLRVFDIAKNETTTDTTIEGNYSNGQLHGDQLDVWGGGMAPLVRVYLAENRLTPLPLTVAGGSQVSPDGTFIASAQNGNIVLFDTQFQSVVGSFPVPTEAYAWTEIGFSADQSTLAVATAATDETGRASIQQVRSGYRGWQAVDCALAGRQLRLDEWTALTTLDPPTDLRCLT